MLCRFPRGFTLTAALIALPLAMAGRPAHSQVVVQFNSPITTIASPSAPETLLLSGTITNFGSSAVKLTYAGTNFPSDGSDYISERVDADLLNAEYKTPLDSGTTTDFTFLDASILGNQQVGLYDQDRAKGTTPVEMVFDFSDGEDVYAGYGIKVTPAAPTPESGSSVSLGLLLAAGAAALGIRALARDRRA